jgi:hypothetical protein
MYPKLGSTEAMEVCHHLEELDLVMNLGSIFKEKVVELIKNKATLLLFIFVPLIKRLSKDFTGDEVNSWQKFFEPLDLFQQAYSHIYIFSYAVCLLIISVGKILRLIHNENLYSFFQDYS